VPAAEPFPNAPDARRRPEVFDANVMVGPLARRPPGAPEDLAALSRVMDDYGLDRALVSHTYAKWYAPPAGNARLMEEIRGDDRYAACWVVLPSGTGEVAPEETQVADLLAGGARAARLCPVSHRLSLEPWEVDRLLGALAERRVPLLLDMDNGHWSEARPWRFVEWAGRTYPRLPLVLLREPQANLRTLFPLLDRCPNLIVETSYFQVHDGIALVAERWGADRLVFGTGLPFWDPGLPVTGLTYAGLSPQDLAGVAGGTLRRLMEGCLV
jgi:predicted TIM-barrel fold metal-dependent hydrolase